MSIKPRELFRGVVDPIPPDRDLLREQIARQTRLFEMTGGKVVVVPNGVSGEVPRTGQTHLKLKSERQKAKEQERV
jgi:hypothetical protein